MAQLAAAGGGAGIGYAFGGPVGAQVGWAAGAFAGSLIFGEDNTDIVQHGPRIQGNALTTSAYGVMRPLSWGEVPIAGNIIDRSDRREARHEQKEESGGKAFGPTQTVTTVTYTYDIDLCLGLGVGPADALYQLYANNELIYDNSPNARFVKPEWLNLRFYKGEDDEQVDPTLEAIWGAGNVPAYAGEIKIVLTAFPLDAYQGQVPTFKAIILKRGIVTAPYINFHTPQDQAELGDFVSHPSTSMMFRALNNGIGVKFTIPVEVIDPMTRKVVKTLTCPEITGYPLTTVTQVVECAGFCSLPASFVGQVPISLGSNRHFYVGARWLETSVSGYVIHMFDAYTYQYLGQYSQLDDGLALPGGGFDSIAGRAIFADQNSGRFTWTTLGVTGEPGLLVTDLTLSDGILIGAPGFVWDFRAVARALLYNGDQSSIRTHLTERHNAQGTDKQGTTYIILNVSDSANPAVTKVLVRVDGSGNMAYHDLSNLIVFDTTSLSTLNALVWDSTIQGIWVTGDRLSVDGSGSAWIAFDSDMNIITEWYPTRGVPGGVPDEFEGSYVRVFDPSLGIIWSGTTSTQDIVDATTVVYAVNTSTLEISPPWPWFAVPDSAIAGLRSTHGIIFNGLTQSVFLSDGSANSDWEVHERKVFSVSADITYLSEPIYDISRMVGVPDAQIDVSELTTTPIDGFQLIQQGSGRKGISPLSSAYLFDMIDTGEKAYFKLRTDVADASIPYTDMGVVVGNPSIGNNNGPPEWDTWDVMEEELPVRVEITYFNKDFQYEIGIQEAGSQEAKGVNIVRRDLSVVMTDDVAKRLADVVLHLMRIERRKIKIVVMPKWLELTAGDVINADHRDWDSGTIETTLMRIDKQMFQGGAVVLEGVRQTEGLFTSIAQGDSSLEYDPTIPYAGIMFVEFLDIPLLREIDNDPGHYVAARGSVPGWVGGELFKSTDDGVTWGSAASFTGPGIIGTIDAALPAPPVNPWVWDHVSKFIVTLLGGGELTSSTKELVLEGNNYCVIGQPGQREVVAFVNAVLVDIDTYECSVLLRGRLGTEWTIDKHTTNDSFVFLNAQDLDYLTATQIDINVPRNYRAVSNGNSLFGAEAIDYIDTNTGVCLTPYAPSQWKAVKDSTFNLHFYWRERTRLPQSVFWAATASDLEQWEVDIIDPDTDAVVRTIASVVTDAPYSRADQITDFGDIVKEVIVKTYQFSAIMGRGYPNVQTTLLGNPSSAVPYYDAVIALLPTAFYVCDDLTGGDELADTGIPTLRNMGRQSGNLMTYEVPGSLSDGRTAVRMNAISDVARYTMSNYPKFGGTQHDISLAMLVMVNTIGANAAELDNHIYYARNPDDGKVDLGFGIGPGNTIDGRYHSFCFSPDDDVRVITGPVITLGQWYQLTITWEDDVGIQYYVDGVPTGALVPTEAATLYKYNCSEGNSSVRCYTTDAAAFDVTMQMMQFYNYILTPQEILDLNTSRSA